MDEEIALSLVIDRCPTCRGVWLDGGELEQMQGTLEAGLTQQVLGAMAFPGA